MRDQELVAQARDGDGEAFRRLVEPYRHELQVHCYRMLGSVQDAEDVLQETLLAAWRRIGGFEERASVRTWLYRIATNRCLNALRAGARRPHESPAYQPEVPLPEPAHHGAGWSSAEVLGALVLGVALLIAFVLWERRTESPMLPMRFFRVRRLPRPTRRTSACSLRCTARCSFSRSTSRPCRAKGRSVPAYG